MSVLRALALAAGLVLCSPALAQNSGRICETYEKTKEILRSLGRVSIGFGIAGEAGLIEVYTDKAGNWNVIHVLPTGIACLVAGGSDWTFVEEPWPVGGIDG